MRHANYVKREIIHVGRNRTTKQIKMKIPREKETYIYLGILESYTMKQEEMKEKI